MAIAATIAAAVALSACDTPIRLNEDERIVVHELTKDMETHCVGRFLIDVPASANVFLPITKIEDVAIEAKPMSEAAHRHTVAAMQTKLMETTTSVGYKYLYESGDGPQPSTRYFVRLAIPGQSGDMTRVVEAYKWSAGYQIKLQVKASDSVNSEYVKRTAGTPYGIPESDRANDVPQKKRLIFDMLKRIEGRDAHSIPTRPGVCFLGGFLAGNAGEAERVAAQFVPADHSDVSFNLETNTELQEPTTLLERAGDINAVLSQFGGTTLRNGPVALPGMQQAEEWLMSAETIWDIQGTRIRLEANSTIGSAATPFVSLDMRTAAPNLVQRDPVGEASLSAGEAVALWDAVSRTLRPRPNGF